MGLTNAWLDSAGLGKLRSEMPDSLRGRTFRDTTSRRPRNVPKIEDLDSVALAFFLQNMPDELRNRAVHAISELRSSGVFDGHRWYPQRAARPVTPVELDCRDQWYLSGVHEGLARVLSEEISRRIVAFTSVPTLSAKVDYETARSIFILGRYLVLINKKYIQEEAANALERRRALKQLADHLYTVIYTQSEHLRKMNRFANTLSELSAHGAVKLPPDWLLEMKATDRMLRIKVTDPSEAASCRYTGFRAGETDNDYYLPANAAELQRYCHYDSVE